MTEPSEVSGLVLAGVVQAWGHSADGEVLRAAACSKSNSWTATLLLSSTRRAAYIFGERSFYDIEIENNKRQSSGCRCTEAEHRHFA